MAAGRRRRWLVALGAGAGAGLLAAALAAWRDWRLNPGGVFHGAAGTNWAAVAETAWSWFWPLALLGGAVALAAALLLARRR